MHSAGVPPKYTKSCTCNCFLKMVQVSEPCMQVVKGLRSIEGLTANIIWMKFVASIGLYSVWGVVVY